MVVFARNMQIRSRLELLYDGATRIRQRPTSWALPGPPKASHEISAFVFRCPVTKEYVTAAWADVRVFGTERYVCYQTFKTRCAAIMYARAVTN